MRECQDGGAALRGRFGYGFSKFDMSMLQFFVIKGVFWVPRHHKNSAASCNAIGGHASAGIAEAAQTTQLKN